MKIVKCADCPKTISYYAKRCRRCEDERRRKTAKSILGLGSKCKRGHKLTKKNLYIHPDHPNWRSCLICKNLSKRKKRGTSVYEL